jgi:hypothetical protein
MGDRISPSLLNPAGPRYTGRGYLSLITGILFCLREEEKKKVISKLRSVFSIQFSGSVSLTDYQAFGLVFCLIQIPFSSTL